METLKALHRKPEAFDMKILFFDQWAQAYLKKDKLFEIRGEE